MKPANGLVCRKGGTLIMRWRARSLSVSPQAARFTERSSCPPPGRWPQDSCFLSSL